MGDLSVEVNDENRDLAQILKSKAMDAITEGMLCSIYMLMLSSLDCLP